MPLFYVFVSKNLINFNDQISDIRVRRLIGDSGIVVDGIIVAGIARRNGIGRSRTARSEADCSERRCKGQK